LSLATLLDMLPQAASCPDHPGVVVCIVLGISSGASIGGWLSEYHGWRSIFYFSLPMAAFISLTVALFLPENTSGRETMKIEPSARVGGAFRSAFRCEC